MPEALGLDIYGTLVDPLEMNEHLRSLAGDLADRLSELWREKQIEYTFRRALMRKYEDFGACTRQALVFAARTLEVELSEEDQEKLIEEYQNLKPFPDVIPGLEALRREGRPLVAFSNGVEATTRTLLSRAGVLSHLHGVVSVDDLKTFKPDPQVYLYLADRLQRKPGETWLVSSNPFDVIGAKSAGLKAAWIQRKPDARFDPWEIEPDLVAPDLEALAEEF
ncbi:MAG TPA: haloacid dehalogenase type II [Rubrobacteraceae bacterium]|nr:haloacid dehalogenase type II [Rubrobacteraceae bacterium]